MPESALRGLILGAFEQDSRRGRPHQVISAFMADLSSIFDRTGAVRRPAYGQLLYEFGALIASGTAEEVRANERVIEAYLGDQGRAEVGSEAGAS